MNTDSSLLAMKKEMIVSFIEPYHQMVRKESFASGLAIKKLTINCEI